MSVGRRLTIWYAVVLTIILVLYAGGVFVFVSHGFYRELDRRVRGDFEVAEQLLGQDGKGGLTWRAAGHDDDAHEVEDFRWVTVWDRANGTLLYESAPHGRGSLGLSRSQLASGSVETVVLEDGEPVRQVVGAYSVAGLAVVIAAARSEERLRGELNELLLILLLGLPVAVGLASLGGAFLARRALAPVSSMAAKARTITADCLSERLHVENPGDEIGSLATVFNETLARLEQSFAEMRRFTADASHELRTPLTAIRSVGEVGLRESRDEPAYRAIIGSMLEEADRMARLVDGLLTLARADGARLALRRERVDLAALALEVADVLGALAEEKDQTVSIETPGDASVDVDVDRAVVRQAVVNLLDNAIKYGGSGTAIRIRIKQDVDEVAVEVVDSGPGVAREHQARIFERFYRVDDSRSRQLGGTGLGLAITRWAIEIHGGRVELESEPGRGSVFRIVLPSARRS